MMLLISKEEAQMNLVGESQLKYSGKYGYVLLRIISARGCLDW